MLFGMVFSLLQLLHSSTSLPRSHSPIVSDLVVEQNVISGIPPLIITISLLSSTSLFCGTGASRRMVISEWMEAKNPVFFILEFKFYNLAQENKHRVESMSPWNTGERKVTASLCLIRTHELDNCILVRPHPRPHIRIASSKWFFKNDNQVGLEKRSEGGKWSLILVWMSPPKLTL